MEGKPYLSIVIPAYNEGGRKGQELRKNLEEIGIYMKEKNISYEVIAVSDGSKDNTAEYIRSLAGLVDNKLEVIDRKENRGKWYSVREGLMKANGQFRLFTDSDGATAITNMENFWRHMEEGKEIIIGSRDLEESKVQKHQPKWKEFLGNMGNYMIQLMFLDLRGIYDTQCGFKVMSENAVKNIIPQMKVDRWGGDFEMMAIGKKMGYDIAEVPVVWVDAGQSLVSTKVYVNTFKELLQVKWRMLTGQYKYKRQN